MVAESIRRPKSEGKREEIIKGSVDVLVAEGVYGATTRRLSAGIGVNLATLHYHFRDKEELLLHVYEHIGKNHRALLAAEFPEPTPLSCRIERLLNFIWTQVERDRESELIVYEMCLYALRKPNFESAARRKHEEWLAHYRDVLIGASDVRERMDDFDIEGLSNLVFTGMVGIIMQWLISGDEVRARRSVSNLIRAAQGYPVFVQA